MKLLESLYIKVFVNIVLSGNETIVYIENFTKGSVTESFENTFSTVEVNEEMVEYINSYIKESPYFYISLLDISSTQGAIPTCLKSTMNLYHDISDSEYKCQNKQWTHYTSKNDLYEIERRYEAFGLDFVFSPFSVLASFFSDKVDNSLALYILLEDAHMSLAVFDNSQLKYADFIDISNVVESEELVEVEALEEELDEEEGIDLDDLDAIDDLDDIESLDDFGDIEDLDSLDDIDEFSSSEDVEEEFHHDEDVQGEASTSSSDGLSEDYKRFTLVQKSINNFYTDSKYSGDFIENVYVADSVGISHDFKRYFEEEMFMSVYVRKIALVIEIAQLAHSEVL